MNYLLGVLAAWSLAIIYAVLFGKDPEPEKKAEPVPREELYRPDGYACTCCGKRPVDYPDEICLNCIWPY